MNWTDTFERADAPTLGATETGGGVWEYFTLYTGGGSGPALPWAIDAGRAHPGGVPLFTLDFHFALVDSGSADGTLTATLDQNPDWYGAPNSNSPTLVFRFVDPDNFWWYDAHEKDLVRFVGGLTERWESNNPGPTPDIHTFSAVLAGDRIQILCDGVLEVDIVDATHNTASLHGVAAPLELQYCLEASWSQGWPLHVVDSVGAGGTVWRVGPDENPDGGILRLVEADGTRWIQSLAGTRPLAIVDVDGTVLTTLPMALESRWTLGDVGWWWDAGLWLGGDTTDLAGYPLSLPPGAYELDLMVFSPTGGYYPDDQPLVFADYFIYDNAGVPTNDSFPGVAVPAEDAHIWVYWVFTDAFDPGPTPPTVDPATLVPAIFGQFGTA